MDQDKKKTQGDIFHSVRLSNITTNEWTLSVDPPHKRVHAHTHDHKLTVCVLQVQDSPDLRQWHQCDVFERGGWSSLPQWTLECIDHFVSFPRNLHAKEKQVTTETMSHVTAVTAEWTVTSS